MSTSIEWTDVTDNIIVAERGGWWCRKISPGCLNCYAAKLNQSSYYGGNKLAYAGEAPALFLKREKIDGWKRQRVAKKHFVASMTDVFGEWLPREWIFAYLDGMAAAPLQTFQVLTKRIEVARDQICAWLLARGLAKLPPNIWIGASIDNHAWAVKRHPVLMTIPAQVHFWSAEPLLSAIDTSALWRLHGAPEWVICGGESGKGGIIRAMESKWPLALRDACLAAGVPFFFKQWGEWCPVSQLPAGLTPGQIGRKVVLVNGCYRIGKKAAGRLLDGIEWSEFPGGKEAA